ncbi:MAG: DUF2194 domain-containing protein [Rhodobiaceae bacterium]|nr:DUF2194 domain-containing protein [Rhodobiaceae bacterium]MCC0040721.1 DUF2194 domain-containing protein [Rhodobiaceae bacterium]
MVLRMLNPFRMRAGGTAVAQRTHLQQVLIISHSADASGMDVMDNLCTALEFGKIGFAVIDIARSVPLPALDAFDSIVICTERIWELGDEKSASLEKHVRDGCGMLAAYRCWSEELSAVFGMGSADLAPAMHTTTGLSFDTELFPGTAGLKVGNARWEFDHSRYDVSAEQLQPDCQILARDSGKRPVAWSRRHGEGRVVYWNTEVLFCRALRGFLLQSVLGTMAVGVSAAAGFAMFHVDDFPVSLSDERREPVASEFPDLDWNGFFFGVWHADMMALREKHGLKYTWYTIINYSDVDNRADADPASFAITSGPEILARRFQAVETVASDDEYGFHGYNHEPLVEGVWPDLATLERKLTMARQLWQGIVPAPLPTSWVPANNWYHPDHVRLIRKVFPEIREVCGIFSTGEAGMGEYREFGPEPWDHSLTCLPRETYGYALTPEVRMMMLSQIAAMGMWTHFVHPDDIYDIPSGSDDNSYRRNAHGQLWRATNAQGTPGLLPQLEAWITQVRSLFPWLDFVTTSEAAARYRAHLEASVNVLVSPMGVEVHCDAGGLFQVRSDAGTKIAADNGAKVIDQRATANGTLNLVRCRPGKTLLHTRPD